MTNNDAIGIIFDLDGVLIDSAEPHFRSWQILAEQHGRSVTKEQFSATFGRQNRDVIPILLGDVPQERIDSLADRKEELYRELIRAKPPIMQGAVELLSGLHQAGVRLAVGSSAPRENIDLALRAMGALEWIPVVVSGGDVTRGKPDPQVFERCAAGLGLDPSHCVVIEDAPAGIEAANAAGMHTVAVLTYHPRPAFDALAPNHIVERLADLTINDLLALVR